ncbi:hypothetical protein [Actinomadura rupiterrae]|uniref:hypothetical protein n=1 Tax=Actinomadura rupiterrae TaxID=559627 RepID=UPI0020A60A7C|nr:hypothetical protein [Actinomadura rupiterrae]MCP2343630.1 hypothetical protein [Actinomadura rupiterrae]
MKLALKTFSVAAAAAVAASLAPAAAHASGTATLIKTEYLAPSPNEAMPMSCQSRQIWLKADWYTWKDERWVNDSQEYPAYTQYRDGQTVRSIYLAADTYSWTTCVTPHGSDGDGAYNRYYAQRSFLTRLGGTGTAEFDENWFVVDHNAHGSWTSWGNSLTPA